MDRANSTLTVGQALRILLVESSDGAAQSVERALADAGLICDLRRARSETEFREYLSSDLDIVIADWHSAGRDGVRASEVMRERNIDVPLIFISKHGGGKQGLLAREPYLLQVLQDISVRKEEERKRELVAGRVARARRAQQVLLECNRALAYESREDRLLAEMCRIVVESGGYVQCWIGLALQDAARTVVPAAAAGYDDYLQRNRFSWGADAAESAMGRVIATGRPCFLRDILNDPQSARRRERARQRGFQSSLTLPLHLDNACIGGLAIYAQEPDAFDEEEIDLLSTLAKDLAYGMGVLRKEATRQRTEAQLARVLRARRVMAECNHALIHATDEGALLREMCRIVVESGGYLQAWIGMATADAQEPVRVAAHAGFGGAESLTAVVTAVENGPFPGRMSQVIASGEPLISRDVLRGEQTPVRNARIRQADTQSSIIMPLRGDGRVFGALSIYAREPEAFDREEIDLVTELAGDIAFGIKALRTRVARERAERHLRLSERRYREMFDQAAVGIARVDMGGVYTDANQKFCDMLGYTRAELVGKTVQDVTHPDDYGKGARLRTGAALRGVRSWANEKRFIRKDGSVVWARRTMSLAQDDAGKTQYIISVIEDITASKAIEQRFAATFSQAAVGFMHSSLDGRVLLVNQRLCEMLGYSAEELANIPERELHYPTEAQVDDDLEARLASGAIKTFALERRYLRKDRRVIWCRCTVSLARDAEQLPEYFIRVFEDITERKETEERYRATVQQAPVGIMYVDGDRRIMHVNGKLCEMLCYAPEELIGRSALSLVHESERGNYGGKFDELWNGKIDSFVAERPLTRKDGRLVWMRRVVSLVRDPAGQPWYFVHLMEDITESKEAEERYRATFDGAPVGILHSGIENDAILHVNRKLCEILGYSAEELLGMATGDLVPPQDRYKDQPSYREPMLAGRMQSFSSERLYVRKDGSLVWANRTISPVRDASGKPLYFIRIIEDISERKRIEQDLRDNIERFEVVARATNDAVWDWDLETDKLWWNDGFKALFGYESQQADARIESWYRHIHPEDRERVTNGRRAVLARNGLYWADEYRFKRADGSDAYIYDRGYVIRDESGKAQRMVGAMMDISERKRAEQALERTARLNALLQALATAANEAGTPEQAFRACLAHLGAFSGWSIGRAVMFEKADDDFREQLSIWHGADDPRWATFREASKRFLPGPNGGLVNEVFGTGRALWMEELPADSATFWRADAARACGLCSGFAFPVIAGARSYALVEFFSDHRLATDRALLEVVPRISAQLAQVAERRIAESALRESERFARATIDALSQHICVVNEVGVITAVNKSWRTFAEDNGYSRDTVWQGENFFHVADKATGMSTAEVSYLASGIRDVLSTTDEAFTTEYSCRANAEQRWFSVKATRFPGPGPKLAVISYENITDRALSHRRRTMEHAVTRVLAEAASIAEAMPKLIRTMCEAMDWAYGALWNRGEQDGILRRVEYWSDRPLELDPSDRRYWETVESTSFGGLLRRGLLERDATWIVDVQSDPTFKRRPSAQKLGLVSAYAFPIVATNKVIGMMEFFGRDVRQPDEMLLLITRSVGSQIGQYIQRKQAEEALRISEERFRITVTQASVGIAITGIDLRYLMVNDKCCEILGYEREELLNLSVRDVMTREECEEIADFRTRTLEDVTDTLYREGQLVRKDGSLAWVTIATSLVRGEQGEPKHYISVLQDVSDRKNAELALRESEEKFSQLSSNIPQVFWIADASLKETIYISSACEQMLGVPVEDLKGNARRLIRAVHPEDRARVYHARKGAAQGQYDEIYRIVRPDGSVRWVQDRGFPVRGADNTVYRVAGIAEDITHRKEAEEKLVYLAHYDALTGLPNRNMFYDRLTQAMSQARRRNKLVAVMFLDLDRFKVTNDTLGHSAGDDLLVHVARRLADRVRIGDTVGRFGGDEFGLILSDLRNIEDARSVAEKIMGAFEAPFVLERSEVYVSGSIGISMYPADSDDEGTLMKNADAAMYRAKEAGRNNFQFYTAEMNALALYRLEMENSLRRALERREFIFHYQPKVDLFSGRITGVEALLRWMRPGRGMVQPAEFVPLLEDTGLIVSIGEWLLNEACNQIKAWEQAGAVPVPVAINLSARQFASKDLGRTIQRVLDHHRISPALLQLELTESSLMMNTEEAVQMLRYLKSLGVHLSIDDFGIGYSSLAYLQLFPIDALKIDRSFVSDITTDSGDATIIRAVIGMAHGLGLKVVAEGVENEAQLEFLKANGCDEMQGFYYSVPLPGDECCKLLINPPPLPSGIARARTAAG